MLTTPNVVCPRAVYCVLFYSSSTLTPFTSTLLNIFLFADDTTIFFSSKPSATVENTLNDELSKVNKWLISNKLSLDINKSCYLNFSLLQHPNKNINIKIANKPLERKRVTKYLRVLIGDKLSWKIIFTL